MFRRIHLIVIPVLAVGVLLGWLAASGRLAETDAQEKKVDTSARSPMQTTDTPGSPSATVTIDGKQLPPPPPKFGGVIKEDAKDSKPYWPPTITPPKGAPNVLLIKTVEYKTTVPAGKRVDLLQEVVRHQGRNAKQNNVTLETADVRP